MKKEQVNLDEVAAAYNEALPTLSPEEQRVTIQLYRLLAEGKPVSHQEIAESLNYPVEKINSIIDHWFGIGIHHNDDKNVIGFWGLALKKMPHRFEVDGIMLYTWCAWDTLFIPEILQKTAKVESVDPITKEKVRLTVTPEGITNIDPVGAVMSCVKPEHTIMDKNVITSFCHYIFFFTSEESGAEWISQHENAALISMDEASILAKRKNELQFPDSKMDDTTRIKCPECSKKGNKVKTLTLQSLLRQQYLPAIKGNQYRFCATATCKIAYYSENSNQAFNKDALKVRVGIKETDIPRPVCYCFNYNIESIELEIEATGTSTASEDIKNRQQDGCWCETRNPQGRCCVGLVRQLEKEVLEKRNKQT